MRFIVDAQLPPALVGFIEDTGHEASHVGEFGSNRLPISVSGKPLLSRTRSS